MGIFSGAIQSGIDEGLSSHTLSLDVQKAYDSVEKSALAEDVGRWDTRWYVENGEKKRNMREVSATMVDEKVSKYVDNS